MAATVHGTGHFRDNRGTVATMAEICTDLTAEHDALDRIVAKLPEDAWSMPTPAEPWTIRDQISHLTYYDGVATGAVIDPDEFRRWLREEAFSEIQQAEGDPGDLVLGRTIDGEELLEVWRMGRAELCKTLGELDPKARIPWFGPDMSAVSFATARLMETWAHGQDVADALGVEREATDRLKHVCHIGIRALPFAYTIRNREVPAEPVRVELKSPSGEMWTWGPEGAANVVRGSALDFALVVTQRRHRDDTDVQTEGPVADEWISIAQAFAGPPGPGRKPGQFRK
jgi:uncharacterized protein (TIGR03084 family)